MLLWENPEMMTLIHRVVVRGCHEYRKVFSSAGWECDPRPGISGFQRLGGESEVLHEFLLYLGRKGVTPESVVFWKTYLVRAFRSFAEDVRTRSGRMDLVFGDLEAEGSAGEDDRDAEGDEVTRAVLKSAAERHRGVANPQESCSPRVMGMLDNLTVRDQIHSLLEHYPLVRDSASLMARLRALFRDAFGEDFPEDAAEGLWEKCRGEESRALGASLAITRNALCGRRHSQAGSRREALRRRETALAERSRYLLRLKPSHILELLPRARRPSLNALTVALHRTRERLRVFG